jgi:alpha-tubulin suppressor-like RCC1 family protein
LHRMPLPQGVAVRLIACGQAHTCIVTRTGELWGCGSNEHGQLGLGDGVARCTTLQPAVRTSEDGAPVEHAACGQHHTVVSSTQGDLWACGNGLVGQLGYGWLDLSAKQLERVDMHQILEEGEMPQGISWHVACGKANTFVLSPQGLLWACGWNNCGQCGVGHRANVLQLERVSLPCFPCAITQVDAGAVHTCLVVNQGGGGSGLWACGYNGHGQRGNADPATWLIPQPFPGLSSVQVASVTCGYEHTCILTADGSLFTCGRNNVGQCANGSTKLREFNLHRIELPPIHNGAAGKQPSAFCTRVVCGNGGNGGHTVVLYSQ